MSTTADPTDLIFSIIGTAGRYQIFLTLLIFLHRAPVIFHQLLVMLHAPPLGPFTCSDASLSKCDPKCPSHKFDHSVWENTIIHQWDLVCDRDWVNWIQSIVMLGILIGSVLFGYFADRFGRKPPLVAAVILQLLSGVGAAFSPGWPSGVWCYTVLRLFSTIATGGTMMAPFALLMEITDKKYRAVMGILFTLPVHIAHASLGPIGYFNRRWDHIQLIVSLFSVLLLSYWCLLPESPRWLITMKRADPVIHVLETGAKCNNLPTENIRPEIEKFLTNTPNTVTQGGNIVDLFRTKTMATKTVSLFLNWMVLAMQYYAIAQFASRLGGNVFLNITLSGLMQIPGNLLCCVLILKIGRKWTLITAYIISSVPMAIMVFLPLDPYWPTQLMTCISLCGAAMTFSIIYIYSAELYPTIVRSFGMGLSSMFARVGSMISPHIMKLENYARWLPPLFFACMPVSTILVTLFFLPETKGQPLPDTVEDADKV